jgi:hypothetical protein
MKNQVLQRSNLAKKNLVKHTKTEAGGHPSHINNYSLLSIRMYVKINSKFDLVNIGRKK